MNLGFLVSIGMALFKWLLRLRGVKSYRANVEVRSESSIVDERKHLEKLRAEVRRLENEFKKIAPQITVAVTAGDWRTIKSLNDKRNELRTGWDAAKQRLDDFERYCAKGK